MVKPEEVEMLVSPPNLALGNKMQGGASFRVLERGYKWHNNVKKSPLPASCDSRKLLQNSTWWWRRWGDNLLLCAQNVRVLELIRKLELWQLFPQAQLLDQSLKFILWKFLTSMEQKLRFHQSADPRTGLYVVISRETERFVNESHKHPAEVRSSDELLGNLQESKRNEPHEERKVTTRSKETWSAPSMKETRAGSLSLIPNKASLNTRRTILTNEKKWITLHVHSRYGGELTVSISKTVTAMLRLFDEEERQLDGSRHWDSMKSVLVRKFASRIARFQWRSMVTKDVWRLHKEKNGILQRERRWIFMFFCELFKDTLVVFQSSQNWWVMYLFLAIGQGTFFMVDFHGTFSPYWEMDWFWEERRRINPVRQSF